MNLKPLNYSKNLQINNMKYPFEDKTALIHIDETKTQSTDEILYQHDIKLLELEQRLNSLYNLVNAIHNHYPVWWGEKDQKY